jgi:hypothetical protein
VSRAHLGLGWVAGDVFTHRKSAGLPPAERGWDAQAKELLYLQIDCPYRFIRQVDLSGAVPFGRRSCPAERQELGPQISCRSHGTLVRQRAN